MQECVSGGILEVSVMTWVSSWVALYLQVMFNFWYIRTEPFSSLLATWHAPITALNANFSWPARRCRLKIPLKSQRLPAFPYSILLSAIYMHAHRHTGRCARAHLLQTHALAQTKTHSCTDIRGPSNPLFFWEIGQSQTALHCKPFSCTHSAWSPAVTRCYIWGSS